MFCSPPSPRGALYYTTSPASAQKMGKVTNHVSGEDTTVNRAGTGCPGGADIEGLAVQKE